LLRASHDVRLNRAERYAAPETSIWSICGRDSVPLGADRACISCAHHNVWRKRNNIGMIFIPKDAA
jgi:hypothetical protein